jgi:hypothetical protein
MEIIECQYSRWYVTKLEANVWQLEQDEGHLHEVEKRETKVIGAPAFISRGMEGLARCWKHNQNS